MTFKFDAPTFFELYRIWLRQNPDAFEIEYKTDMNQAFEVLKNVATFTGNIDLSGVLALGTPVLVRHKTTELLNVFSRTNRFILNLDCALPASTPEANLKAYVETARNYR